MPDERALFLSDVLCTSYNAVKNTRVASRCLARGGDMTAVFWLARSRGLGL